MTRAAGFAGGFVVALALAPISAGFAVAQDRDNSSPYDPRVEDLTARAPLPKAGEPPMRGIHWSRDFLGGMLHGEKKQPPAPVNPDMVWHGGTIMTNVSAIPIFWGKSWVNPTFVGDKIIGLSTFFNGIGGSHYADTVNEYTGTNGKVTSSISSPATTPLIDTSPAPKNPTTRAILAEVCKMISNPLPFGYYHVYTDVKRAGAFCGWHSFGTCGNTPVQFAFTFNLDGDLGCDPEDTSGLHSQGLAALANVTAHELSEARSDPTNGGWYDAKGEENGDKCAWTFGVPLVTLSNFSQWKLQGEWSNHAFDTATGYPNGIGQDGCLSGQ